MANINVNTTDLLPDILNTVTAEAALEISNMPLEQRGGFFNSHVTRVDVSPEKIRQMLLEKVWAKCIKMMNVMILMFP